MNKKALVTGGAGFIGNAVARELLSRGFDVICYDDLSVGKPENLPDEVKLIVGDIRDEQKLTSALSGCHYIFHLAARVSIRKAVDTFIDDAEINSLGTLITLRAAKISGVRRFFYASSMAVYGDVKYSPQDENHPINPTSPYGIAKFASERYILTMAPHWGIEPVIGRFFNTYGPRQTPSPYVGVITIFCKKLFAGENPVIFGDGNQLRDFIHVSDIARGAVDSLLSAPSKSVMNFGTGIGTSVNKIARILIDKINPDIAPIHSDPVPGEPGDSIADFTTAKKLIGWSPKKNLEDGIIDAIDWNRPA